MFDYISVMLKRLKPAFSRGDSKSNEVRHCNLGGYVPISFEQEETRQVTSVPVCVQKMLSLASGRLSNFDKSFLKVHMMSGNVCIVRCLDETKVQDVISHVINHLSDEEKSEPNLYSLMAVCQASDIRHWLHRDMTVSEFHKELCSIHPAPEEWRFELKIRFFFNTLVDLLQTDRFAFFYLFDQVKNNLREQNTYEKLEKELAIVLVSLEIRLMLRERIPKTPNRKANNMTVDDLDWKKELPKCFLPDTDTKILSRSMQKALKSCLALSEEECVLKYLNLVSCSWRYFEESYECQLCDPTSTPTVKVIVGPTVGIVYKTVSALIVPPTTLAKFDKIKSVETLDVGFGQLKITFRNGQPPVILQCLSKYQNKQLAYLIDGYCILLKTIAENSFELDCDKGGICRQSVTSDIQAESHKQASDYAILEETTIDEIPLPAIEDSPDSPSKCTCPEDSSCQSAYDEVYIRHSSIFPISQSNKPSIVIRLTNEVIEEKLRLQKQQSVDDAAWLQSAEAKLIIGENNLKSPKEIIDRRDDIFNISINSISKPVESSDNSVDLLQKVKLDRSRDELYCATTALVQSVVDLNCAVQQGQTESLVGSVTRVKVQLKVMLNVVHSEVSSLSPQTRLDVELARKTLHSDLQHLINALKMVLPCNPTDLAQDYQRKALQLGHALALDAKTLFDTIDVARKKVILAQDLITTASTVTVPISKASHE